MGALRPSVLRIVLPLLGLGAFVLLGGCGGEDTVDPGESNLDFTSTSSEYNGDSSDYSTKLSRSIGGSDTTITVSSGSRRFRIVLNDDVLKKGQRFDLDDSDEARATYDEGSDKVWVAYDGRAEVTEELLGNFRIRLTDLQFAPADDSDNQALGTFEIDGRLIRE